MVDERSGEHEIGTHWRRAVRWRWRRLRHGLVLSAGLWAAGAHANGIAPSKVSVPKGPGSVEGLAAADYAPSPATGSASYEIPLAVPPASAGFGPQLALSYDSGGGVTEIGIGWRLTGAPRVRRRTEEGLPHFDDTDTFELVGLGIPSELVEVSPRVFRPSVEDGSFVRLVRSADGGSWEARTKAGVTLRFGGEGFTEAEGEHVSGYLLREEFDRHGHRIGYEWDSSRGHALLERIRWNAFDAASTNEVRFEYEDRPDVHRRFSRGIRQTLTERLRRIEVTHGGALVRRYELGYADGAHPVLQSIQLVGKDGTSRLPASRFEYTEPNIAGSAEEIVTMRNAPGVSPSARSASLADVDGDGLPDLLVGEAGRFRSYVNHDGLTWRSAADWGAASPSVSLSDTGVELADLDADGAPDLVVKSGAREFRYFPRPLGTRFDAPVSIATVPSFSFEDANVRLADLDGDRRTDVVVTTEAGIAVGYNRNGSDWTEPTLVGKVDASQAVSFADGHTSLCDVNGDRVEDLCSLRSGALVYWLGRGRGVFEPAESAEGVPEFDVSAPYQLVDANGDGWVDLIRVGVSRVELALATAEGRFAPPVSIDGTPSRGPSTAVELADMNGSGTTDVVWVDVTGEEATSWRYLELFPDGRAGLLRRIDDGLGKVQTIEYEPAALHAARARDAGRPWTTRIDVAMPVVRRTTTEFSLGDPPVVTEFTYRDGAYDARERTFAGFGGGVRRQLGDDSTPTLLTDTTFDLGLEHRELRGSPLEEETRDDSGHVFSHTSRRHTSRREAALNGRTIGYSFASSELVRLVEGGASPEKNLLTEIDQDQYGNVVEERRFGLTQGADVMAGGDEAITVRTFANDPEEWLLGYVSTEELTDGAGRRVALTRKYYDGAPFEGLPLGEVRRGDVSREEAWVGPGDDAFELVIATRYDDDGLPLETRDGRSGGRFFEWAADRTSILSERVKLDGPVPLVETAEVDGAFGTLTAVTDYAGQTTSFDYDAFGRLVRVVKPGDSHALPTVAYTYDVGSPLSRIVTESRVASGTQDTERSELLVDGGGRERGTLTRDGDHWLLAGVSLFDARGQARRSLLPRAVDAAAHDSPPLLDGSPRGRDVWRDAVGRETRTRSPSGSETRTEYAPLETRHFDGGQADASSPYEHTPTVEQRDGLGRVATHGRTLDGKLLVASYAHDARGALVSRKDPEGHVARYDYDGRGRRVAVHDPDLGDHRFTYDATGNVVARRFPDGVTARFTFDLAGRSLAEDWNGDGTPEIQRRWDVAPDGNRDPLYRGKLARVAEPSGSVEHTYDARGRVTATRYEIDGAAYVSGSEYDDADREAVHVYPDGSRLAIRRNARGQVAGYAGVVDFDYADDGLEIARRFSTGARVTSEYDDDRKRTELTFTATDGSVIEHLRWTYDRAGNVTALSDLRAGVSRDHDRTEAYGYDNLYRLVGSTGTWGKTTYRYSPSGNLVGRTSTVPSQELESVTYGARPHTPVAFDGRAVETDARGRMTHDGVRRYTWNEADQLTSVTREGGGAVDNVYGDDGVRRLRTEHHADGTETTTHFIDAWAEAKDGKLLRYVVHAGQRIVQFAESGEVAAAQPRAAGATPLGPLCLFGFAVMAVIRMLLRSRARLPSLAGAGRVLSAASAGAALAVAATSAAPAMLVLGVVLGMALCGARRVRVAAVARCGVATLGILAALTACNGGPGAHDAPRSPRDVGALAPGDTILATDLVGSTLAETNAEGIPRAEFATFPFGATRYDTSHSTRKFAASPRDGAVGLDHMGARFYAPELGVWTSGDPAAVTAPERLVTAEFAAANPYAYARQSPLIAADRDGHFWHLVVGAVLGAAVGAGIEAGRQFLEHGKVEDWGRVGAAAAGGMVAGTIVAANPAAGLAATMSVGAGSGAAAGVTERLVASGGKDAGSVTDVALDAGLGAATAGVVKGAAPLVRKVAGRVAATGRGVLTAGHSATSIARQAPGTTVLGHYPEYVELANRTGANHFNIAKDAWDSMTPNARWDLNSAFLDSAVDRGDVFKLATPLSQIRPGSYFEKEVERLLGRGYSLNLKGTFLRPDPH